MTYVNRSIAHGAHHSVLLVVVTKHWEATAVAKPGRFPKSVVVYIPGHSHQRGIRGAHPEVPVHLAQAPLVSLEKQSLN